MEARNLVESDYDILSEWWKWNRFPIPPKEVLPNGALGGKMVVDELGNNICSAFLYNTDSALAWIEFCVSSPYIRDRKIRKEARVFLIKELTNEARERGYLAVFASIKSESLIQDYIEAGYSADGLKTTELIIRL
jgi:hypothetical protein